MLRYICTLSTLLLFTSFNCIVYSGAGKSTLLNVLSHRNISAVNVTGTVFLNGSPVRQEINTMSAYVQQEDLFIGTLTVREHLMFQVC